MKKNMKKLILWMIKTFNIDINTNIIDGDVVVNGNVTVKGDLVVNGSLIATGNVTCLQEGGIYGDI